MKPGLGVWANTLKVNMGFWEKASCCIFILIVSLKISDSRHVLLFHTCVLTCSHVLSTCYEVLLFGIRLVLALPEKKGRAGAILSM